MTLRWENAVALGTSRKNADGFAPLADVVWFCLRLQANGEGLEDVPVARVQKRIVHLVSQQVETGFCEGKICLRERAPKPQDEPDCQTPWTSATRARNATMCREELIKRFPARNAGFVFGSKHTNNDDLVDIPGAKGNSVGTVAAHQFITAYFGTASVDFLNKISAQRFRHFAIFEDGAKVSTHEAGSFSRASGTCGMCTRVETWCPLFLEGPHHNAFCGWTNGFLSAVSSPAAEDNLRKRGRGESPEGGFSSGGLCFA